MVLFKILNVDANNSVPVLNFPPVMFICIPTIKGITGSIKGAGYPEISLAVTTTMVVPVEEDLYEICMKYINVVVNMEFDGEASR